MITDDRQVTLKGWLWRVALALVGCAVAGYVFDQVTGGGALGWAVMGAILGLFCWPLFRLLLLRNQRLHGKNKP